MKVVIGVYTDDGRLWGKAHRITLTDEREVLNTAADIEAYLEQAWTEIEEGDDDSSDIENRIPVYSK